MNEFDETQKLLQDKADYQARIALIPYDGSPEVTENASGKYLYVRKRVGSSLTSTYVDVFTEDFYRLLLRNAGELRELKKTSEKSTNSWRPLAMFPRSLIPGSFKIWILPEPI